MNNNINNIYIMDHPLVQHKISILRDKNTSSKEFRELIHEITMLMCYESMRNLKLHEKTVETPLQITKSNIISRRYNICSDFESRTGHDSGGSEFNPQCSHRPHRIIKRPRDFTTYRILF